MHLGNKIVFSLMIVREWELIGKLSETTIPLASPLVFFFFWEGPGTKRKGLGARLYKYNSLMFNLPP